MIAVRHAIPSCAALAGVLIATLAVGCRTGGGDALPAPPTASLRSEIFLGTALSGPIAGPQFAPEGVTTRPATAPAAPLAIDVSGYVANVRFHGATQSLGSRATLVVSSEEERPWQATPRQLADVRIISGTGASNLAGALAEAPAGVVTPLGRISSVVQPGLTALVTLDRGAELGPVLVHVTPRAGESGEQLLEIAVASEAPGRGREIVLTEWPADLDGDGTIVLRIPPAAGRTSRRDTFLVLTTRRADPDGGDAEGMRAAQAVLSGEAGPATRPVGMALPGSSDVAFSGAIAALQTPGTRRAALAFIARETQASLTEEVALSADDELLETLAARLADRWSAGHPTPTALAFELERETLTALAEMEDAGTLPPEMRTLLVLHAGEAGRRAASLEEALGSARSLEDLRSHLAAENAIYLEDNDPAARVRAFEWLAARGMAPHGYDPLAPAESRRAALEAALSEDATSAQTQPAGAAEKD